MARDADGWKISWKNHRLIIGVDHAMPINVSRFMKRLRRFLLGRNLSAISRVGYNGDIGWGYLKL